MNVQELRKITKELGGTVTKNGKYKTKDDLLKFINSQTSQQIGGMKKVRFADNLEIYDVEPYGESFDEKGLEWYNLKENYDAYDCIKHILKEYGIRDREDYDLIKDTIDDNSALEAIEICLNILDNERMKPIERRPIRRMARNIKKKKLQGRVKQIEKNLF